MITLRQVGERWRRLQPRKSKWKSRKFFNYKVILARTSSEWQQQGALGGGGGRHRCRLRSRGASSPSSRCQHSHSHLILDTMPFRFDRQTLSSPRPLSWVFWNSKWTFSWLIRFIYFLYHQRSLSPLHILYYIVRFYNQPIRKWVSLLSFCFDDVIPAYHARQAKKTRNFQSVHNWKRLS